MGGDKNEALALFLRTAAWDEYLDDEEVRKTAKSLKKQVDKLQAEKEEADGDVDMSDAERFKLVVVGDGAVGKTSLLISYSTGKFPSDYVPTVFENYTATVKRKGKDVLLHLWDTAGQEDYDRLRPLSYPGTDVVLLCFSLCNRNSFESVKEKWYPEVSHHLPSVPYILVGTKVDLRDSKTADPNTSNPEKFEQIEKDEGKKLASELECVRYMEVSAKTRKGLEKIFEEAISVVIENMDDRDESDDGDDGDGGDGAGASEPEVAKEEKKEKRKSKKESSSAPAAASTKADDEEVARTAPPPKSKKKKEKGGGGGGCMLL